MTNKLRTLVQGVKKRARILLGKKYTVLGIAVCILVIAGVGWIASQRGNEDKTQDCKEFTNQSRELIKAKKYAEAHTLLSEVKQDCDKHGPVEKAYDLSKSNGYVEALAFKSDYAVTLIESGNKSEAKKYAEEAGNLNSSLSEWQRSQLIDVNERMTNVFYISRDAYINGASQ